MHRTLGSALKKANFKFGQNAKQKGIHLGQPKTPILIFREIHVNTWAELIVNNELNLICGINDKDTL